ncbi:hypothetical protein HJ590_07280 [Naumannella sp. ID2617S]|nr:hypothetical protein [Naumannella sp. ID2617S]
MGGVLGTVVLILICLTALVTGYPGRQTDKGWCRDSLLTQTCTHLRPEFIESRTGVRLPPGARVVSSTHTFYLDSDTTVVVDVPAAEAVAFEQQLIRLSGRPVPRLCPHLSGENCRGYLKFDNRAGLGWEAADLRDGTVRYRFEHHFDF